MKKIALLLTIFLLLASLPKAELLQGVKAYSLGGAYSALADDGSSVFWNPGAPSLINSHLFSCGYGKLFTSLNNGDVGSGYVSYSRDMKQYGTAGLFFTNFSGDIYSDVSVGLNYSKRFNLQGLPLGVGANFKWLRNSYNDANFRYISDRDDPEDPLFSGGNAKDDFTIDIGVLLKPYRKAKVSLVAQNITDPDLAFSKKDYGGKALRITSGLSYKVSNYFTPTVDLVYSSKEIDGRPQVDVRGGIESWIEERKFCLRAGGNRRELTAGFTWRNSALFGGIEIDYGLLIPLNELSKTNALSHRVGLNIIGKERKLPQKDVLVKDIYLSWEPRAEDPVKVNAVIKNGGKKDLPGFPVSLAQGKPGDSLNYKQINTTQYVEGLAGDSEVEISWKWVPPKQESYKLRVAADDNGTRIPEISGKIEEANEDNNVVDEIFEVGKPVTVELSPEKRELNLTEVVMKREERPIVPIVFFNEGESKLDSLDRFKLTQIVSRLKDNKDVVLRISGFYNPSTDSEDELEGKELARDRAMAVKDFILKKYNYLKDRVEIVPQEQYEESKKMVTPPEGSEFNRKIAEENQRVELQVEFKKEKLNEPVVYKRIPVSPDKLEGIKKIKQLFWMNQDLKVIAKGCFKDSASYLDVLKNTLDAEKRLSKTFDDNKIGLLMSKDTCNAVEITVTPEGVLYFPVREEEYVERFSPKGIDNNVFDLDIKNFSDLDSFEIGILRDKRKLVRMLATGTREVPDSISWDWRDKYGNLVNPGERYYLGINLYQESWKKTYFSEPMRVKVKKSRQQIEKLIMVLYKFDRIDAESRVLESRINSLADRIQMRIEEGEEMTMNIIGHTDIIGSQEHNMNLSQRRARKELAFLKKVLMIKLNKENLTQLNKYLKEQGIELNTIGEASKKPFTDGRTGEVIGDNETPSGRNINRRVMVEIKE